MQSIRDQLMTIATAKRDEIINGANNGADDDLPLEERPNRAEVSPGCLLKPFDELEIYGTPVLYLCPGRGIGWLHGLTIEGSTIPLGQYEATAVTDRIPADPEETPMPIFAEPAEPPP
jgi:hypothetical protein